VSAIRPFDSVRETAIPLADLHKLCFADPWDGQAIARLAGGPGFALIHGTLANPNGFILARAVAGEAEVLTIATHPQKRRSGVGHALLRAAATEAEARGATKMFLEVDSTNIAAIGLYIGLGFVKTGERKGYYRLPGKPPSDALILTASLPLAAAAQ
jgi:ribosomal-protein-alanine N-acetyltransferase